MKFAATASTLLLTLGAVTASATRGQTRGEQKKTEERRLGKAYDLTGLYTCPVLFADDRRKLEAKDETERQLVDGYSMQEPPIHGLGFVELVCFKKFDDFCGALSGLEGASELCDNGFDPLEDLEDAKVLCWWYASYPDTGIRRERELAEAKASEQARELGCGYPTYFDGYILVGMEPYYDPYGPVPDLKLQVLSFTKNCYSCRGRACRKMSETDTKEERELDYYYYFDTEYTRLVTGEGYNNLIIDYDLNYPFTKISA